MLKSISMIQIMKSKAQVIFDIGSEKFKYLEREEKKIKRVDMRDLNARLNETKKANLYNNSKIIILSLFCLGLVALISLKF
jgi:hypothetical protein